MKPNNPILTLLLLGSILALGACSSLRFPGVHEITVQQGNVISQGMIDKLKPGMSKSQVRFVLGNPVVDDSLRRDRWEYVYAAQIPGRSTITRKLILHFADERLSYFEGDYKPTEEAEEEVEETTTTG